MVRFRISPESPVPPSAQLFEQISFAIASRQIPVGTRLPSLRQLSMQTGLHRNTISKVYNQLVVGGMVQTRAGSGVYVLDHAATTATTTLHSVIRHALDLALGQGYNLRQVREVMEAEFNRHLANTAQVMATSMDSGTLTILVQELEEALGVTVQGVHLWELAQQNPGTQAGIVVTQRYDLAKVRQLLQGFKGQIIPLDIQGYQREIELVEQMPAGSTLGIVSVSSGILRIAEIMVQSMRGQNLLVLTAQLEDTYTLTGMLKTADLVIADEISYHQLESQAKLVRPERPRSLRLHRAENYIAPASLANLRSYLQTT